MKKFIMICLCSLVCMVVVMGCRRSQSQTAAVEVAKENQATTSEVVVPLEDPKQIESLNETESVVSEQSATTSDDNSEPFEMDEKAATPAATDPATFVRVKDYIDHIHVELKYNTTDNFTGQQIYDFSEAYLRYGTVQKLIKVQEALMEHGLSLKIWDAFRPIEAQFVLWEVCPNPTYQMCRKTPSFSYGDIKA